MSALPLQIYDEDPERDPKNDRPFFSDQPTVGQVLDWYEANPSRTASSPAAEKERRRVWDKFREKFGKRLIDDCKPFHLYDFINGQAGLKQAWSRRRWGATIQRPFNMALKYGVIRKNPFQGVSFPQGECGRDWTDEEYRAMLRASHANVRRVIIWVRFSGMRPGEVRHLRISDIDVEGGRIVIERHKSFYVTKQPRIVPLNTVLLKLVAWCKRHNPPAAAYLFLNSFGRPWYVKGSTCSSLTTGFRRARRAAGLAENVKLHGGRHTFATQALMNGVGLPAVMEILGHRQLATTQRYTHMTNKINHLAASMERAIHGAADKRPAAPAEQGLPSPPVPAAPPPAAAVWDMRPTDPRQQPPPIAVAPIAMAPANPILSPADLVPAAPPPLQALVPIAPPAAGKSAGGGKEGSDDVGSVRCKLYVSEELDWRVRITALARRQKLSTLVAEILDRGLPQTKSLDPAMVPSSATPSPAADGTNREHGKVLGVRVSQELHWRLRLTALQQGVKLLTVAAGLLDRALPPAAAGA